MPSLRMLPRPGARTSRAALLVGSLVIVALVESVPPAAAQHVVVWNKLGSLAEVQTSEVGHDAAIVGTHTSFEPAQHGNGYLRMAIWEYLMFAPAAMRGLADAGTIELWINSKVPEPVPYVYGVFGLIGTPYNTDFGVPACDVELLWGDTVTGIGFWGWIGFGSAYAYTDWESTQFVATPGVPFHVALVWDVRGIDGTAETIRVYRDGVAVTSSTMTWDGTVTPARPLVLGYGPDMEAYDKFIVDNIKIWDGAVTDFSHRFEEDWPYPVASQRETWSGIKALFQ